MPNIGSLNHKKNGMLISKTNQTIVIDHMVSVLPLSKIYFNGFWNCSHGVLFFFLLDIYITATI